MDDNRHLEPVPQVVNADDLAEARMVGLTVTGMGCVNCGTRVRNSLVALEGVVSAVVDWERGLALVDYVPHKTGIAAILDAVAAAGNDGHHHYRAQVISKEER